MFLTRGESEFEVSIRAVDSEWEGKGSLSCFLRSNSKTHTASPTGQEKPLWGVRFSREREKAIKSHTDNFP